MLLHVHRGQSSPNFQIFQRWHRDHRRWSIQIDQRWGKQQYDNVNHRKGQSHRRGRVQGVHRKLSRVRRKEFHALRIRYVMPFSSILSFELNVIDFIRSKFNLQMLMHRDIRYRLAMYRSSFKLYHAKNYTIIHI